MSKTRLRIPGHLKLVIRHTVDDKPWLSDLSRDQIAYALGYATGEPGVTVHAAFVHGDCCALLVTDTSGLLHRCTQRLHTCLTELTNRARGRERGTIWDNRKPAESFVVGWFAVMFVIGLLAVRAANAVDSDDPYDCPGFFGPRSWGTYSKFERPDDFNSRSIRPPQVHLNPKPPDCAPRDFYLEDLIADVDFEARGWIAESRGTRRSCPRPGKRTYDSPPELAEGFGEFIGPADVVPLLQAELTAWRKYYERCRIDFQTDQLTAFPAGTCKFRELGAATNPCPTYVAPPQPPRHPPRPPPA